MRFSQRPFFTSRKAFSTLLCIGKTFNSCSEEVYRSLRSVTDNEVRLSSIDDRHLPPLAYKSFTSEVSYKSVPLLKAFPRNQLILNLQ